MNTAFPRIAMGGDIFQWILMVVCLCGVGCGTVQDHRMRQYSRDVRLYSPDMQWKLANGVIEEGFSSLQVYIALGNPWEKRASEDGQPVWSYVARPLSIQDKNGTVVTGWKSNADFVWGGFEPLGELIVKFHDDRVIVIEYLPPL